MGAIHVEFAVPGEDRALVEREWLAVDAIFEGVFVSKLPGQKFRMFGHLGIFPAQMRVTRIVRFEPVADVMHPPA